MYSTTFERTLLPRGPATQRGGPVIDPVDIPACLKDRSVPFEDDPGFLCVHFSADGREHGMWIVALRDDVLEAAPATLPADLWVRWCAGVSGLPRASVCRGRDVLCDAVLLADDGESRDPADTRAPRSERGALRAEGLTAQQAALLTQTRQRPLLATVARRAELPAPTARLVHRMLLGALPGTRAAAQHR
jgi:hypothetical protein